jgi:hypothetical protein
MADWCGTARSNYFQVRDEAAFRDWAEKRNLHVFERPSTENSPRSFGFYSEDEYGGWPSLDVELEEETGDGSIDLFAELPQHLQEGQIAVLMEIGAEKHRYLTGVAVAVDHAGKTVEVTLDDIYQSAANALNCEIEQITRCSY